MGEISNQNATHRIQNSFLKTNLRHYDFYHHSSSNKRGVAMLVKKNMGLEPVDTYKDQNENILLIKFQKDGVGIVLGSVYGPNTTDRIFYNNLSNFLEITNGCPVILAGDWNTTWDNSPPENNIDIANMVRSPNAANGALLRNLATHFNLTDPYRVMYPNVVNFSYSPFGVQRKNRSRIDFFVVSTSLINSMRDTGIFNAPISSMFDHKPIFLSFKNSGKNSSDKSNNKKRITNWFLDDNLIHMTVTLSTLQIFSKSIDENFHGETIVRLNRGINLLCSKMLSVLELREKTPLTQKIT
jgi:exonuclease III